MLEKNKINYIRKIQQKALEMTLNNEKIGGGGGVQN